MAYQRSTSPPKKHCSELAQVLRGANPPNVRFQMDSNYDYSRFIPDPEEAFEESAQLFEDIQQMANRQIQSSVYEMHLIDFMTQMIFTSNSLENAGASYSVTSEVCSQILGGQNFRDSVDINNEQYNAIVDYMITKKDIDPDHNTVLRARRQVMQHAYALKYIMIRMVVNGEALSDGLLKETHQILTDGIDAENDAESDEKDRSETYGGMYRTANVGWTPFSKFVAPEDIPKRIAETVAAFNTVAKEVESTQTIDPFQLATKFGHMLLNIRPFLDGNSRLTRLFMNTILLKYTGIIIPIGRDEVEAAKWKETVTRAAEIEITEEEYRGGKAAWAEFATLVAIQGRSTLRALKDGLEAEEKGGTYERRKSVEEYGWD